MILGGVVITWKLEVKLYELNRPGNRATLTGPLTVVSNPEDGEGENETREVHNQVSFDFSGQRRESRFGKFPLRILSFAKGENFRQLSPLPNSIPDSSHLKLIRHFHGIGNLVKTKC